MGLALENMFPCIVNENVVATQQFCKITSVNVYYRLKQNIEKQYLKEK